MFGEIGEMCDKPHAFTMRTRKLSQLLRLSECALLDKIQMIKSEAKRIRNNNFFQHHKDLKNSELDNLSYEFPTALTSSLPEIVGNNISKTKFQLESKNEDSPSRVIIYRHHPWKNRGSPGKLVNLPKTIDHLLTMAGRKFGFHPVKVFNEDGAEIEDINVIRDNDRLYFADREELEEAFRPTKSF